MIQKIRYLNMNLDGFSWGLEDLKTIGRYFKNQEEDAQYRLRIDVASADDEDTATFTDPELLSGSSLPEKSNQYITLCKFIRLHT